MDLKLKTKKALVLGATSGLGLATARQLSEEGADVIISGRDKDKAEKAVQNSNIKAAVIGDLIQVARVESLVEEAVEILGGLDIIIINSGGGSPGGLLETDPDIRDKAYSSMLRPAMDAALAATPYLKQSDSGRMIFVTARSIVEATPELALSSVFRSGVSAAARSLALELAPDVLVNVVIPGQYDTPAYHRFSSWAAKEDGKDVDEYRKDNAKEIPLGRLGRAEEFADVVTFLCSPRASFVNGSVIRVDGGAVTGFH